MLSKNLIESVKKHEGLRLESYQDSVGVWTIGYGHNLESHGVPKTYAPFLVIDEETAERWLRNDLKEAAAQAEQFEAYHCLNTRARRDVFVELLFNMGPGTLSRFNKGLAAMLIGDWDRAADELKDSRWYRQVGWRGPTLVELFRKGTYD